MLDIKLIRENPTLIEKKAKDKGINIDVKSVISLDEEFRKIITDAQKLREEKNLLSSEIKGKPTEAQIKKGKEIKERLDKSEKELADVSRK